MTAIIQAKNNNDLGEVSCSGSDKKDSHSEYFEDKANRMYVRLHVRGIKIDFKDCGLGT